MKYALREGAITLSMSDLVPLPDADDSKPVAGPQYVQRPLDLKQRPEAPQKPGKPWDNANPRVKAPFALRLNEETHLKLQYLVTKIPNTSMQKLALQGVEELVERLLSEYDKD